jgi:hypothetical protein
MSQELKKTPIHCKFCQNTLEYIFKSALDGENQSSTPLVEIDKQVLHRLFVCDNCFLIQSDASYLPMPEQFYSSSYGSSYLSDLKLYSDDIFENFRTANYRLEVSLHRRNNDLYHDKGFVFGTRGVYSLIEVYGKVDQIACHDELSYVNDINDFMKALKLFLKPSGKIDMEIPHLLPIFEGQSLTFSPRYRYPCLSLTTVDKIMKKFELVIFDADPISKVGWLRISIKHRENMGTPISKNVMVLRGRERNAGMSSLRYYIDIGKSAMIHQNLKDDVHSLSYNAK